MAASARFFTIGAAGFTTLHLRNEAESGSFALRLAAFARRGFDPLDYSAGRPLRYLPNEQLTV